MRISIVVAMCAVAATLSPEAIGEHKQATAFSRVDADTGLVGKWQRTTTCAELVAALKKAGLQKFVLDSVVGNGFVPGVTSADRITDPTNPCKGAVPRKHSHFFTKAGAFGSLDWRGQTVDDGTYRLATNRTLVISKEFPKVTFHYTIQGNTITFAPVIPNRCTAFRCLWAISMAYPGKTWRRVP